MSKARRLQEKAPSLLDTPVPPGERGGSKWAVGVSAFEKVCKFFWNQLTIGEKFVILLSLGAVLWGAYKLGTWRDTSLWQIKLESQTAISEREKTKLDNEIADLKRKVYEKKDENEPTVETAKAANRSYRDFLNDLNTARSQGPLAVSTLVDQFHYKSVKWDCVILETDLTGESCKIGLNDKAQPKDRALARFGPDEFDGFVRAGARKTIEGIFATADDFGIILINCRFTSDSERR